MRTLSPDAYKRIVSKLVLIPVVLLTIGWLVSACSKEEEGVNSKTETETPKETTPNTSVSSLKDATYYIHQEINLSSFLTTNNGYKISKVEVLDNGVKTVISDPTNYVFDKWGEYTLIYTASKEGSKDEEVTIEGFKVNPLGFNAFQIEDADNAVHDYNFKGNEAKTDYQSDIEIAKSGGLFDLESLILEAIANGTTTLKASEVKSRLARNRILLLYESPNPEMDEYSLFDRVINKYDDNQNGSHAWTVIKIFLMGTKDVITKLGTKALYSESAILSDGTEMISYVKNHPDWIFHVVNTHTWLWSSSGTYDELLQKLNKNKPVTDWYKTFFGTLDNIYFACSSFGNTGMGTSTYTVFTSEDVKNGMQGTYGIEWDCGADGIMGSTNYQSDAYPADKFIYADWSLYPTKENLNKENLWMEHTYANPNIHRQATSYAAPAACAKSYLMTCAQLLVNPKLTKAEARKFVRETAQEGTVNYCDKEDANDKWTKEFYGNVKVMNPAGAFYLFHSTFPSSIDVTSTELIPITHGLHKNSVVVGPGVVDKDGNAVTESNYTEMIGKDFYIDPTQLYDYGYTAGGTCDYVEYLCVDGKGSGAMDRESEAYKSITSKTFTVTLN